MNMNELNNKINTFFKFTLPNFFKNLPMKIKNFPGKFQRMSMGEQIAYVCIILGIILIITSLFLF